MDGVTAAGTRGAGGDGRLFFRGRGVVCVVRKRRLCATNRSATYMGYRRDPAAALPSTSSWAASAASRVPNGGFYHSTRQHHRARQPCGVQTLAHGGRIGCSPLAWLRGRLDVGFARVRAANSSLLPARPVALQKKQPARRDSARERCQNNPPP